MKNNMQYRIPEKLIEALSSYLVEEYQKGRSKSTDLDINFFAEGAGELSQSFTKDRSLLPKNYLNEPKYRAGYILYFVISNYLKAYYSLEQIDFGSFEKEINVLDIGSGPGTALLATIDFIKNRLSTPAVDKSIKKVNLLAIEQNIHILKDARTLLNNYSPSNFSFSANASRITGRNCRKALGDRKFDIIFLSNIINELGEDEKKLLCEKLIANHLSGKGYLVIIEPALKTITRDLMRLRDNLVGNVEGLEIVAPCSSPKPCPMLTLNKRDWCHMYLEWERPELIEKIDKLIGNRKDYLKFSYMIFSRTAGTSNNDLFRVVSSPLVSKGKIEQLICGNGEIIKLMRQNKNKTEKNRAFDNLKRGDLIRFSGSPKIGKEECGIEIIR